MQDHRCAADLPRLLGSCHGPEAWPSSSRPVRRPGCRVSASGDCFWRRCTTHKTSKNQTAKWRKVPCDRMILFCSVGPASVRPSRGPCWQQACSFLASGDHFWPCQAPAPTGAAAFSRTCKRATTLPTGVGAVRTCKRVTVAAGMSPEKIKMRPGRRPGLQQKSGKMALFPAGSETRTQVSSVTA